MSDQLKINNIIEQYQSRGYEYSGKQMTEYTCKANVTMQTVAGVQQFDAMLSYSGVGQAQPKIVEKLQDKNFKFDYKKHEYQGQTTFKIYLPKDGSYSGGNSGYSKGGYKAPKISWSEFEQLATKAHDLAIRLVSKNDGMPNDSINTYFDVILRCAGVSVDVKTLGGSEELNNAVDKLNQAGITGEVVNPTGGDDGNQIPF